MKVRRPILYTYFLGICFTIAYYFFSKYLITILAAKYTEKSTKLFETLLYFPFAMIYMWIPGIVASIFAKKEKINLPVFTKLNKYFLYAILFPILFSFLIVFSSMIFSKIDFAYLTLMLPPSFNIFGITFFNYVIYFSFLILILMFYGITFNTLLALGQELMWRGYLLEKFKKLNFWHASLIIGILWGLWYFPITIIYGQSYSNLGLISIIWMLALTILSTPLYIYLRTKGKSILITSIFHGLFNAIAPYSIIFFKSPNNLLVGPNGIAGFIIWIIVNFFLYLMLQKKINS